MDHIQHATLHLTLLFILVVVNIEAGPLTAFGRRTGKSHHETSPSYEPAASTNYSVDEDYSNLNYTEDVTELGMENDTETSTGKDYELNMTDSFPYSTSTARYTPTAIYPWSTTPRYPTTYTTSRYPYTTSTPRYPYTTSTSRYPYTGTTYPYWRYNYTTTSYPYYWHTTPRYGQRLPYYTTTPGYPYMPRPYYPHYQYNATTAPQQAKSSGSGMTFNTINGPIIYKICVKCRFFFHGGKINETDADDDSTNGDEMNNFNS